MTIKSNLYERAFDHCLRASHIPCVPVNEAQRAVPPDASPLHSLKSFDVLITHPQLGTCVIDVKGRRGSLHPRSHHPHPGDAWVTLDDLESLAAWQNLFGEDTTPLFVFVFSADQQPADGSPDQPFLYRNRWYWARSISLRQYQQHQLPRSSKWGTVHLPRTEFSRIAKPFPPLAPSPSAYSFISNSGHQPHARPRLRIRMPHRPLKPQPALSP